MNTSDIVHRLRGEASDKWTTHYVLLREAADEIERLRDAIQYAHSCGFEWPSDPLPKK